MSINKTWFAFGFNLFSAFTTLFAGTSPTHGEPLFQEEAQKDVLQMASLQAMESSWLALPHSCKARGFNAEPQASPTSARAEALAVFDLFDQETV